MVSRSWLYFTNRTTGREGNRGYKRGERRDGTGEKPWMRKPLGRIRRVRVKKKGKCLCGIRTKKNECKENWMVELFAVVMKDKKEG